MDFLDNKLLEIKKRGNYRTLRTLHGHQGTQMKIDNKMFLLFCSNDYLGIASNPQVKKKAAEAINEFGCGSGASRLISGTMKLHEDLENKIANFKKKEAATVFNSGYTANIGIFTALLGKGDIVFSDKFNHASIVDGIRLSGANLQRYPHNNLSVLEQKLSAAKSNVKKIIVTDGIFSMDGDIAPLPKLAKLASKYDTLLMVDDAHGTGVFGKNGRGCAEHFNLEDKIDIHMGTFSKAIGSFGGFAAGNKKLIDIFINCSRSFMYSTSLPPGVLAASIEGINMIEKKPNLRKTLTDKVTYLRSNLKGIGFKILGEDISPIIPILIGPASLAIEASNLLYSEGILVPAVRPPTVPQNTSRLRITISVVHTYKEIDILISKLQLLSEKLGINGRNKIIK